MNDATRPYPSRDLPDSSICSYEHHPIDDIEPMASSEPEAARAVREIVIAVRGEKNAAFAMDCLSLATGIGILGNENGQTVAQRWGVTRQKVSKTVGKLRRIIVGESDRQRSEIYRQSNWRNIPKLTLEGK